LNVDVLVCECSAYKSTLGHDIGIAVLCIIIILLVIIVAVLLFRRCARHRRRLQFMSSMKGTLSGGGSNSAVNFVTMMEEPEMMPEFQPRSNRQLEIIGTTTAAATS